jgi:excisionase family DNA binding protein
MRYGRFAEKKLKMTDIIGSALEEARRVGDLRRAAMTLPQASEYAGLSRSFIYKLFEQQALTRLKAGKRVLILKDDLDAYLHSIRQEA